MTFDPQPTLVGPSVTIRPMRSDDRDALYEVARDPELWAQHPANDRWRPEVFDEFIATGLASGGGVVLEDNAGRVIGSSRFYEVTADSAAIGYTFIARQHWGGATNAEVKYLMVNHVHASLPRAVFYVGAQNLRSRRAMEKIGGTLVSEDATSAVYEICRDAVVTY